MRREHGRAPRELILSLVAAASFALASCRVGYDELGLGFGATSGGSNAGSAGNVGATAGSSTPATAGASSLGGASELPGGGSSATPTSGQGPSTDAGAPGTAGATGTAGAGATTDPPGCTSTNDCSCASLQGHNYWFCTSVLVWTAAEAHCETQAMQLVRIDSQVENGFLVDTGTAAGVFDLNGFAQIGANDQALAGEWRWVDGTLFWQGDSGGAAVGNLFSVWIASSPSSSGVQRCSGLLSTGKWQTRSCTAVVPFICESQ